MGEEERRDHAEVMEYLRQLEQQHGALSREVGSAKAHLEHEIEYLKDEIDKFCQWINADSEKSAWFYEVKPELRDIVESTRWVKLTNKILAWTIGTVTGAIMAWSAAEVFIKEHLP